MRVHHRNLASFVGYSHDNNRMALVYEYMANDRNIHPLKWEMRLKIAIDAAQGLEYLHHGCRPTIIHRDVKSANILLSENLDAKMADFGLSKGLLDDQTTHILTDVIGTSGYLDPDEKKIRVVICINSVHFCGSLRAYFLQCGSCAACFVDPACNICRVWGCSVW
ncbi:probable LRR receptor-like serine/threonine-protein kinase At4g29180 isoform X2 [Helianthus annuus]|uniref:probable LRR receptor-like serine/threonine-protein kinase At4g29180 isoform X2 n=1 Tax=Helianthus annuus TaxID=4232 RepID=UPI000B8FEAF4|nr:probable LRR receptor-like serine/threonine-protein kinase At4g29180 isoform X2 [Helianthus annuus]XP_035843601.1 probable LRR receptor-like serine/threonine-protein kinase At4g29180 isoform X2 [Helianthus annuus]